MGGVEPGDAARPLRPGDLARLLLAGGDRPPRPRARDQRADLVGAALRRQILDRVAALDPDPDELEPVLARIVVELGEPVGPSRSLCASFLHDWHASLASPGYWAWLIREGVAATERTEPTTPKRRRGSG